MEQSWHTAMCRQASHCRPRPSVQLLAVDVLTCLEWCRFAFVICTEYMPSVDSSSTESQPDWWQHLICLVWTIAMPCWPDFQLLHWYHFSESCMPFWISSHMTVCLRLSKSWTGYQSPRGSSTSGACWFTSRCWVTCQSTSWTC